MNDLINNIDKVHTTVLGKERIKKNLQLDWTENNADNIESFCKEIITSLNTNIYKKGKNYYCVNNYYNVIITINSYSYTIITAHKI